VRGESSATRKLPFAGTWMNNRQTVRAATQLSPPLHSLRTSPRDQANEKRRQAALLHFAITSKIPLPAVVICRPALQNPGDASDRNQPTDLQGT
jgi:hypothetical protein